MIREYLWSDIERELFTPETPADIRRELELEKIRSACKLYGITYSEQWITFRGRIGFAQVVAAKIAGKGGEAKRLEREWLEGLEGEDG
jgi:hypothetical protein